MHRGEHDSSYYTVDYNAKLRAADAVIKKVHCCISNSFFIAEDESLYAIGHPNVWKNRWAEQYEQDKSFHTLKKPKNCVNYVKTCASSSSRMILTREGNLFCQGENIRHYIDSEVDRN